jgi:hypothetical protein
MVPAYLADEEGSLPVRRISNLKVPGMDSDKAVVRVPCPRILKGDPSAFAFYMHEKSLAPVIRQGVLLYCSKMRDPGPGDTALLGVKGKGSIVRIITDITEEGLDVLHLETKDGWSVKSVRDVIPFDDLDEISLIIATSRYTV